MDMPKRVSNSQIVNELSYITDKIDYANKYSKEHRGWVVSEMSEIKDIVKEQNGRIRKSEISIGWFKGIATVFSIIIGWIFKKTM